MRLFRLAAATLAAAMAIPPARAATAEHPTCDAVQVAFTSGSYDSREAVVDALQDHLKAARADAPLGRDGKVQAILLAAMRCRELGAGDFMAALDRSAAQVAGERARHKAGD